MRPFRIFCIFVIAGIAAVALIAGCSPQAEQAAPPTATPAAIGDLEAAAEIAQRYLDAWQAQDIAGMHRLLSFRHQESTPLAAFSAIYASAHSTMTLLRLEYRARTMRRDGRVLAFQYDITFHTRLFGTFSDADRELHIVHDSELGQWRIAWSPADVFAEMGDGAQLRFEPQMPTRANIYDRNGKILADQNGRVVRVFIANHRIPDRPACFQILAQTTNQPLDEIIDLFDVRSGADWEVDAGIMEPLAFIESSETVQALCNAEFRQQATRRYLHGALMPHILGNVGYPDADDLPGLAASGYTPATIIGKSGIEASMNATLAGQPGGQLWLAAANGAPLRTLAEAHSKIPESLWLTIDADLQENIQRLLAEAYHSSADAWGSESKGAAVVVMDVNQGEVLALVSYPSYDGNSLNPFPAIGREAASVLLDELNSDERLPQINRPTQGIYPTGSVMKVASALAALESGGYDADSRYFCSGSWTYGGDTRYDWLEGGHGSVTVRSSITSSCNPFFYELGFRLNQQDPHLLPDYIQQLGLGAATGIQLIPELRGNIPTPDNVLSATGLPWSYAFAVNLSIGQGELLVTPLQMARLYAAVANGGHLLRPQLVRERGLFDQRTQVATRDVMSDAEISAASLAIVQQGMCDVTGAPTGTATRQFLYSPLLDRGVCGKTGTANAPGDDVLPHSWFIAYAPADEPQIVVATLLENAGEGSLVAAPLTRSILEYYFLGAA